MASTTTTPTTPTPTPTTTSTSTTPTTTPPPPPPPSQLIPGLPDDVAIWCLARIPKSQHPAISLVSKSWHSALHSPSLFTTRSLLGLSESFLYLNLRHHSSFFWYVLITKPNSKFSLIPLPQIPIHSRKSINSQSLDQIHTFSSRTSVKIQSLGQIDSFESRKGVENQPFGHIEDSESRGSVEVKALGDIEPNGSGNSVKIETLGGIEDSSLRSSMKMQPLGMSHLLNAPKSQPIGPAFAVVGSRIYLIGGSNNEIPSNGVWVFDCRFNVWEEGPRMRVGREFSAAGVVEGKIYVMGGCVVDNWTRSKNWAEVFDPVKGVWEAVPSPMEVRCKWMHASAVIGGKVYAMADRGGVVYDVSKGEWGSVTKRLDLGWRGRAAVVGGVLYCYDYLGKIRGYVVEDDRWKELRGVDKGLQKFLCGATMVNFDGKLCVVWEGKSSGKEVDIMCAVIEVKKDVDGGLSGEILWSDVILTVPHSTSIVQCLVVEL